jgi:hypothetical protein
MNDSIGLDGSLMFHKYVQARCYTYNCIIVYLLLKGMRLIRYHNTFSSCRKYGCLHSHCALVEPAKR